MILCLISFAGCDRKEDPSTYTYTISRNNSLTPTGKVNGTIAPFSEQKCIYMHNGKMYKILGEQTEACFMNQPDEIENAECLGVVKLVTSLPRNDGEGAFMDEGDEVFYLSESDVIFVHRIHISDYPWMLLQRWGADE